MSAAVRSSGLVFRRTWSYRWIGAPIALLCAVLLLLRPNAANIGWAAATGIVACLAITLGLWLPSRQAALPLRVLAAMMFIAFTAVLIGDLKARPASYHDNGAWIPGLVHSGGGFVLFAIQACGLPSLAELAGGRTKSWC